MIERQLLLITNSKSVFAFQNLPLHFTVTPPSGEIGVTTLLLMTNRISVLPFGIRAIVYLWRNPADRTALSYFWCTRKSHKIAYFRKRWEMMQNCSYAVIGTRSLTFKMCRSCFRNFCLRYSPSQHLVGKYSMLPTPFPMRYHSLISHRLCATYK